MKIIRILCLLTLGVAIVCGMAYFCFEKRVDLEKVRTHYVGDSLKLVAVNFLLENMDDKFAYSGEVLNSYDTLFSVYKKCLMEKGYTSPDPMPVRQCWDSLTKVCGLVDRNLLDKVYDWQTLSADELIEEIDVALEAWQSAPEFVSKDFDLFCLTG